MIRSFVKTKFVFRISLCFVHCDICLFEYFRIIIFVTSVNSNTYADIYAFAGSGQIDILRCLFVNGLGSFAGNLGIVSVLDEYNEFITAETPYNLTVYELFPEDSPSCVISWSPTS